MRNLFNMDNPLFQTLGKLADLMILNLVFLICCIPVVTIGASLTALNYVTLKLAEKEEGYIVKGFFKSFKENFKQSTIIWLIMLVVGIVLGLDIYIMSQGTGTFYKVFNILLLILVFVYYMVYTYVFPILARFYNTTKATFKNALIMSIADFPRTLIMMVIPVAAVIITVFNSYTLMYGILVWIMFGFSMVAFVNCLFMKKVFAKYMPKDEDADKDPDEWVVEELPQEGEENEEAAELTEAEETEEPAELTDGE